MAEYQTKQVDGGYAVTLDGKTVVTLKGKEGALTPVYPADTDSDKQACFDKCFAASDGTTGAAHKCASQCGLT